MKSSTVSGSFWVIAQGIEAASTEVAPSDRFTGLHRSGETRVLPERRHHDGCEAGRDPSALTRHGLSGPLRRRVGATAAGPGGSGIPGHPARVRPVRAAHARPGTVADEIIAGQHANIPRMYLHSLTCGHCDAEGALQLPGRPRPQTGRIRAPRAGRVRGRPETGIRLGQGVLNRC